MLLGSLRFGQAVRINWRRKRRELSRNLLLCTTALVALSSGAAFAQEQGAAATPTASTRSGELEEVVVTAEKRAENLQQVPLAVTSLDADLLKTQRVVDPQDLNDLVPNANFQGIGAATGATISIRGIATSNSGPDQANGVAVHEDGAYLFYGLQPAQLFDIQRLEVDPGPQGTVFGRAAAAGAVNIITNKPNLSQYEAGAEIEAGTYSLFRGEGMINVPLSDTFAVRAAVQSESHDGYFSNGYNDADNIAGRFQALWVPYDGLSVRFGGDYLHVGGLGSCYVFPIANTVIIPVGLTTKPANNIWDGCGVEKDSLDGKYWSVYGEINYDLGFGVLNILPSYHQEDQNTVNQTLAPGYNTVSTYSSLGQKEIEARINAESDNPLQYVAGIFAYNGGGFGNYPVTFNAPGYVHLFDNPNNYPFVGEESYSIFGQATYPVLDWLKATIGARYSYDEASNRGSIFYGPGGPPFPPVSFANAGHWWNLSWKASLEADLTPENQVYITSGTGYKPGGINGGAPPSPDVAGSQTQVVFGPEKIWHAELGTKNRFFNNRLQINDAFYYDWYENYEISYVGEVNPQGSGIFGFTSTNNGRAQIYGNELSLIWLISDSDRLDVAFNYFHGTFNELVIPVYLGPPYGAPVCGPSGCDYRGAPVPQTPEWSGVVGYQHVFDFPDGSTLMPRVSSQIRSSYYTNFTEGPGSKQGAYTRTTLNLTYASADERWSIMGYVKNVENAKVLAFTSNNSGSTPVVEESFLDPRTAGVVMQFHFAMPRVSPVVAAPPTPPVVTPPTPPVAAKVEAQRQFQVFFDFDKSDITDAAAQVIKAAADAIKAGNVVKITVTGHTDTVGSAKYNQALSERRAAAVKAGLVADGVGGGDIATVGVGKTGLLVPTADGVREPQNRRAVIELQ